MYSLHSFSDVSGKPDCNALFWGLFIVDGSKFFFVGDGMGGLCCLLAGLCLYTYTANQ
jgi:hypothetical protein